VIWKKSGGENLRLEDAITGGNLSFNALVKEGKRELVAGKKKGQPQHYL